LFRNFYAMKKWALVPVFLFFTVCLTFSQTEEKSIIQESLVPSLTSDKFLSNISVLKNGRIVSSYSIKGKANWSKSAIALNIGEDSIRWNLKDSLGVNFQISYPNEYSLHLGKDKKELDDELIEKLKASPKIEVDSTIAISVDSVIRKIVQIKEGILFNQYFENQLGERILSNQLLFESTINSLMFPKEGNLPGQIEFVFHLYGKKKEVFSLHPKALLYSLPNYESWSIWSGFQGNFLLLLFQHPDLNFHHMLSLKVVEEKLIGDFYSFIPNANYLGLITKSEEKEVLFNLDIKNK
jgi:hypothetical protein